MPTVLENLETARATLATALAANAGKPNYSIDGQSVSYGELMDRMAKIDAAIATASGPVEVVTHGVV